MKCSRFLPLKCLGICLAWMLLCVPAPAQKAPAQPSKPINIDKELEEPTTPDRAASYFHFSLAKWKEDSGDIPGDLSEMQIALKYNQNSPGIHLEMASLLEKTGSIREAIEHAQEAARLDPKSPDPHWLLVGIYFKQQERGDTAGDGFQKAIKELEELRELTPTDERVYYALGGAYFDLNEPEKAIQAFEKFQSLATETDSGYKEIAKYYEHSGNDEKAVEYLLKALEAQPDSAESLSMLGILYSKLNKNKEAIPIYQKLLEVGGSNLGVSRQLAASLLGTGEYAQAADILTNILKTAPSDTPSRILMGRAQIGMRKLPEATETFQSLLEEDPDSIEAQFYLGTIHEENGQYAEAVKLFSSLLDKAKAGSEEAKSNYYVFQQHLAANYMEMADYEKAIALYQEMVKTDPKTNAQLIEAYRISRQFDKALSLGKQQYEKDPTNIQMGIIYGFTLADAGKSKEGAEILSKLLQSNPQNLDLYIRLSRIYVQDKRYDDAEKILRRAQDKKLDGETNERLNFELAAVYERQKNFDRAESLFKEVLKINPNNAVALNYFGYMLADRGVRLEEAVKYVKEALAIDPNNGAYLDSLGWAFFKLNDLDNAEKYLLQASELVKNDATIDDHLGDLYFKLGNFQKAQDFWTRSVRIGTEPEDVQKVRQKLEALQDTLRKQKSEK